MRTTKANKLLINFFLGYNDIRAFEVFKWTVLYIFKCKATNEVSKQHFWKMDF